MGSQVHPQFVTPQGSGEGPLQGTKGHRDTGALSVKSGSGIKIGSMEEEYFSWILKDAHVCTYAYFWGEGYFLELNLSQ